MRRLKHMTPKKTLALLLALLALALPVWAAKVDATATSASVTFASKRTTVLIVNCGTGPSGCISANKVFVRVFGCNETIAATTAVDNVEAIFRLEPGESISKGPLTGLGSPGWCGFSYITAGGETATIKYTAQ